MATTVATSNARCQADLGSQGSTAEGNDVSLMVAMLRASIDESGWKHAAVASALSVEPQYLSRMLSGEKPWTLRHVATLPHDIEAIYARRYAQHFGLIVVERVDAETAERYLACGLFNILARPRPDRADLPKRASAMAKADL